MDNRRQAIRIAAPILAIGVLFLGVGALWAQPRPRSANGLGADGGLPRAGSVRLAAVRSDLAPQFPSLVATANGPVTVGAPIRDTAVIAGGIGPTGTLVFRLFGPDDPACSRAIFSSIVAVDGNGAYRSSVAAPALPGVYQWMASYNGDAHNLAVSTLCPTGGQGATVLAAVPSLVATASAPAYPGSALTDTVLLSGGFSPTGTLTFALFGSSDPTCTAAPAFTFPPVRVAGNGTYSSGPFTPPVVGTYRFAVRYSGDATNISVPARCESTSQETGIAPAVVTISSAPPTPSSIGGAIVARLTLSGGDHPGGTVTFLLYGPSDPSCTGPPAFASPPVVVTGNGAVTAPPFTPTRPGTYIIVTSYSGDASNAAERSACDAINQSTTVSRAIPTIAAATSFHAVAGDVAAPAETVSDGLHPTGTITFSFYSPADPTCTAAPLLTSKPIPVHGAGSYSSPPFVPSAAGDYRFITAYSGDANNVALTTDCNAVNQALLVSDSGIYNPADHPRQVIQLEVVGFSLLAVGGSAGAARAHHRAASSGNSHGPAAPRGTAVHHDRAQGSVAATGVDNRSEGWEAMVVAAAAAKEEDDRVEATNRGDRSRTWRWPGTGRVDRLSMSIPARVAPASPLVARIANDAGYLRAIFGSASAALPAVGVALAVFAVRAVHHQALPPPFIFAMAIAVLGVLDAFAGLTAVAVFVAGIVVLGGVATTDDARTLMGLASLWFAVPIIAGVARPLRRAPTRSTAEHVERGADVVVAMMVGAWAVIGIIQGLPGLSGKVLPIAGDAYVAAVIVLAAVGARMILETIAAHHYPVRLAQVQAEVLPVSGRAQHVVSGVMALLVFVFVAVPYVGLCWQLYLGGAFFATPLVLKLCVDRLPNFPKLYAALPRGILQAVVMLAIGSAFGALVAERLHDQSGQQVIRESFVLLSLPGVAYSVLQVFGREGPGAPKIHWLPEKVLGATVLVIGLLFVVGIVKL